MKRFLPFVIIIAVALAAAGGGTALYRMKREAVLPPIPGESANTKPGAKPPHYRGAVQATVVLEEFADLHRRERPLEQQRELEPRDATPQ